MFRLIYLQNVIAIRLKSQMPFMTCSTWKPMFPVQMLILCIHRGLMNQILTMMKMTNYITVRQLIILRLDNAYESNKQTNYNKQTRQGTNQFRIYNSSCK